MTDRDVKALASIDNRNTVERSLLLSNSVSFQQCKHKATTACSVPLIFLYTRFFIDIDSFILIIVMKIQWPPGRFYLVFVITYLPNFLPAQAKPPSLILSRATRPVRSPAAVRTTPWAKIRKTDPYVHSFRIHSDIQFRFSRTKVQSIIVNPSANKSHEVTFQLTLPDTAFISKFSM